MQFKEVHRDQSKTAGGCSVSTAVVGTSQEVVDRTHIHYPLRRGRQPTGSEKGTFCGAFKITGSAWFRQRAQQQTSELEDLTSMFRQTWGHSHGQRQKPARCFNAEFCNKDPKKRHFQDKRPTTSGWRSDCILFNCKRTFTLV